MKNEIIIQKKDTLKIFLIGQTTLHWGRMEFGNIGNYYVIEPFIRELHNTFKNCEITTTLQMSKRFCKEEKVNVVPMELYYGWKNDLEKAKKELKIAEKYFKTGKLEETTPYIEQVLKSDLIIDFSGDIWGDNADFLGDDRFLVGLYKNRIVQLLKKKNVMLAGSPGPFNNKKNLEFARKVFADFDLVTNRESLSREILIRNNFNISKLYDLSCPSFLFESNKKINIYDIIQNKSEIDTSKPIAGFIISGWNFSKGPYNKWPRADTDYITFAETVEFMDSLGMNIVLISHSNGFIPNKKPFKLIHGRDFPIIEQLYKVIKDRKIAKNIILLDGIFDAWETKAIIGSLDMLVSGRLHGAVAGLSQFIPTVIIDYGHEPKAHKLKGFAIEVDVENFVADPNNKSDLIMKIEKCYNNREKYAEHLRKKIPEVKKKAKMNFELLKNLI